MLFELLWYKDFVHWKLKLLNFQNFLMDSVLIIIRPPLEPCISYNITSCYFPVFLSFESFLKGFKSDGRWFKNPVCIGNTMISSDICHKYHEWYFEIHEQLGEWNLRQFWNITSDIYVKHHVQIMLLCVYTTTRKRFVIFTYRYFKLSWNTTAEISHVVVK